MNVNMIGLSAEHLLRCDAHAHREWEIVACLQGSCSLRVGEREIAFEPGVIVCQPPGMLHSAVSTGGYQDIWVRIDDFVPTCPEPVPVFQDDEAGRFTTLLKMLYESFISHQPNGARIAAALWDALYQLLVSWSTDRIENPAVSGVVHEMILNLSNSDFDLGACIRRTGYNPDHFRRCFRRELGQTPTAYLITLRLEHACRFLELPDCGGYTVKQVAQLSGFEDPYYFSTLFKKKFGCSPTAYLHRNPL